MDNTTKSARAKSDITHCLAVRGISKSSMLHSAQIQNKLGDFTRSLLDARKTD